MNFKNLAIWGVIVVVLIGVYSVVTQGSRGGAAAGELSYSQLLRRIDNGDVKQAVIHGTVIEARTGDGKSFTAMAPANSDDLVKRLEARGADIQFKSPGGNMFVSILLNMLPILLLIGVWIFFMRQMQGGAKGAMGFGKSKARLLTENKNRITFEDVAGVDEAKEELQEIVDFLKDPAKFQRLGGKIPKGALLIGPPGTGKTLIARAVAGEAGVPFFTISGSDFVEMFVGVGASRVRDMFEQAKKNAPCIIFIDEIDAVGRHRGAGLGGGNDEREQTLNQLLVEMDGFEANEGIILIAATNRPDVLDPALLRPGRFDRQVVVPNPDVSGREKILRVHMRNVPLSADVDVKVLARGTPGFSGADLANLVNEAALAAARKNRRMVTMHDFEHAKDKVMMGAERRSMAMSEEEKRNTAYHEGGHAIVAINVPSSDPVHKATIVPRGRALGMVMQLPEGDRYSMKYVQMTSRLAIMMGGRVAEELIFGKENITSGASSDIKAATNLARAMVTQWGYSDELGMVAYGDNQDEVFLGHSVARTQNVSEETARKIDAEVKRLVDEGYNEAKRLLTEKAGDLEILAQGLLEYETLSGEEINNLLLGVKPVREDAEPRRPGGPSAAVPLSPRPGTATARTID
ncbi:MAG: cell division protein FtsH [Caulobacter sp.]|nr:cell division protein FtsH [Caulobacter sp.]